MVMATGTVTAMINGNGKTNGLSVPPGLRLGSMNGNSRADIPAPIKMSATPSSPASSQPLAPPGAFVACDFCLAR